MRPKGVMGGSWATNGIMGNLWNKLIPYTSMTRLSVISTGVFVSYVGKHWEKSVSTH